MKRKLITKICLREFYYPMVNSMNLIFSTNMARYNLLENLVTRKTTVNDANADQIYFIINLMNGNNESKLIDIKAVKDEFFYNTVLKKATKVFLDTKKKFKKAIRSFLPDKFREYISTTKKVFY